MGVCFLHREKKRRSIFEHIQQPAAASTAEEKSGALALRRMARCQHSAAPDPAGFGHNDLGKATEIMKDVYQQILLISTIAAIVTASVALLMMNFSRSGRTVEESRAWLKRIAITWAILNGLGFIMAYVTPFFSGGQWTA